MHFRFVFSLILSLMVGNAIAQTDYFSEDFLRYEDFVYNPNIRTVLLYKEGFEMAAPIVALNSDERLVLTFDDLSGDYAKYEYTIIHCDADWNPSDLMPNEYLETFTDDFIDHFEYSLNTMQQYIHYHKIIPNEVIRYKLSGNYLLKVYLEGNPDDVILTRRFFVVDQRVDVAGMVRRPSRVDERNTGQELQFTINAGAIDLIDPFQEVKVTIRQNGRWDNSITDVRPRQVRGRELVYDHVSKHVFDGGSDFRFFDIKSFRYNSLRVEAVEYNPMDGYQVFLHEDQIKKKHVYQTVQESINGRFLIKTEDMPVSANQAEYAVVHFFLLHHTPLIDGKLYLMGGLTYWQFLREAELTYNYQRKGFEASILLKQGFYNYQYLLLPNNSKVGDVTFAEGSFYETNNEYTFYVYFRPQGSRYDQLVNVTMILTHPN
jgi:hypothetical protein